MSKRQQGSVEIAEAVALFGLSALSWWLALTIVWVFAVAALSLAFMAVCLLLDGVSLLVRQRSLLGLNE